MAIVVTLSHAPPLQQSPFNNSTAGHKDHYSLFFYYNFSECYYILYLRESMYELMQEILTKGARKKKLHASFL